MKLHSYKSPLLPNDVVKVRTSEGLATSDAAGVHGVVTDVIAADVILVQLKDSVGAMVFSRTQLSLKARPIMKS